MLNFLDLCKKTYDTQMQEAQAPGADSSSQGNAYILSSFVRIKSETARGNGEGKTSSLPEHLPANRLCSLMLPVTPCSGSSSAQQNSFSSNSEETVPPLPSAAFPLQNNPRTGGMTVPLDPLACRCGGGLDVYKKLLVHPLGRCFSLVEALPAWVSGINGLANAGMKKDDVSISGFIEQLCTEY